MASKVISEMFVRNAYGPHFPRPRVTPMFSEARVTNLLHRRFAQAYQAPPDLPTMAKAARAGGAGVILLTCSDPRLNPYQIFGVDPTLKGITMIRNAGGRAVDAVRTISVLQTIGDARTVVVMHHTGEYIEQDLPSMG